MSKRLTAKGRFAGNEDGWIEPNWNTESERTMLLAMMQGEKPRYEIKFTNNGEAGDSDRELDIKIIAYRMLQGHFSRINSR
eukprot:178359-Amphidinium_carterae.1